MHTLKLFSVHGKNLRSKISMIIGTLFFLLFFTSLPSFAVTIIYEYDALNRLQVVNYGNGFLETYAYDGVGNRTSLDIDDVEPPTGTIPSNNIALSSGNATLTGTASDLGSGVQKVEISIDGGQTWHLATGTNNWSYTWATTPGTYNISVRVTDNGGNTQVASYDITVFADPLPHNPDILWRNTVTGENYVWFMNGTAITGGDYLSSVGLDWKIVGIADFNSDGNPDILWRNTVTGENYIWFMDGTAITGGNYLSSVGLDWKIAGTADFNSDGNPDILWSNTATAENYVWFMNGTAITGGSYLSSSGLEWIIVGITDFSGDGKPDILFRNTATGENYVWFMNGTAITGGNYLSSVGLDWEIVGTGDFNNDGNPDILWRNQTSGENIVWYMSGVSQIGWGNLSSVPDPWKIVGTGDFNGDG